MANFMMFLVSETVAIVCAVAAGFLAWHDKSGWGWFLLISVISQTSATFKGKK